MRLRFAHIRSNQLRMLGTPSFAAGLAGVRAEDSLLGRGWGISVMCFCEVVETQKMQRCLCAPDPGKHRSEKLRSQGTPCEPFKSS